MEGFRGISLAQDSRFKSADKKLLAKMKFAPELDQKVDLNKVEIISFRVWVAQRITSILGFEDEVVVELVFGHLETPAQQGGHESNINPKDMQIQLTGFLGAEQGMLFMKDLWILLLSAQANCKLSQNEGSKPTVIQRGVPTQFIEEKQKAYEQERRRIAALAEKKIEAVGGSRDGRDVLPKTDSIRRDERDRVQKVDSSDRGRDGEKDSSRAYNRDDGRRHHDRDSRAESDRSSGCRGVSNTPAWMVSESESSKVDRGHKVIARGDREDRRDSRVDEDIDRQRRRDSGGSSRGTNAGEEGRGRGGSDGKKVPRRDDERDRSRERDAPRESGRRDRSRDRERNRHRSRSDSREWRRRDQGSDVRSSRSGDDRVRRSRRSRSPVVSSSSSEDGSLSPASK